MAFPAIVQAALDRLASFFNGNVYGPANLGGFDGDGHSVNFVPALRDVATVAGALADTLSQTAEDAAATAADRQAAADSATAAASAAARITGTSTTSRTPSVASLTFTTQADKAFEVGSYLLVQSRGTIGRWAFGKVSAYAGTSVTIAVEAIGPTVSAGTDWNLSVSGLRGVTGATGPFNAAAMYDFNLHYGS